METPYRQLFNTNKSHALYKHILSILSTKWKNMSNREWSTFMGASESNDRDGVMQDGVIRMKLFDAKRRNANKNNNILSGSFALDSLLLCPISKNITKVYAYIVSPCSRYTLKLPTRNMEKSLIVAIHPKNKNNDTNSKQNRNG